MAGVSITYDFLLNCLFVQPCLSQSQSLCLGTKITVPKMLMEHLKTVGKESIHKCRWPDGQSTLTTVLKMPLKGASSLTREEYTLIGGTIGLPGKQQPRPDARTMSWWCPPVSPLIQQEYVHLIEQI